MPLPPEPIITRWGTWLTAVAYYCDHFEDVRAVVNTFNDEDAESIVRAKQLFSNNQVKTDIVFVKSNFSMIPKAINKLESKGLELNKSLKCVESVHTNLNSMRDKKYVRKLDRVLQRNVGFGTLKAIRDILYFQKPSVDEYIQKLTPDELAKFKFAPTTSCDAERTFSAYKQVFTDRRKRFSFENLKKHMIVKCNFVGNNAESSDSD